MSFSNQRSVIDHRYAIGNLMLAIQSRTFNSYFYLLASNANHPARFLQNKVTGILFENKVDYASLCLRVLHLYLPYLTFIHSRIARSC